MLKKISIFFLLLGSLNSNAQILGGGVLFSNAVTFSQSWISGCPAGGTQFSNQVAFDQPLPLIHALLRLPALPVQQVLMYGLAFLLNQQRLLL